MMQFSSELLAAMDGMGAAPSGLTLHRVLNDPQMGRVKVRSYSSELEAIKFEKLITELSGSINLPRLWGRYDRHLVFQFLNLDQGAAANESGLFFEIGKILGVLNKNQIETDPPEILDAEFSNWMSRFQEMNLLPERVAKQAVDTYLMKRPAKATVCWDYWDAMPHNFGFYENQLYMVDEKHLRPSFKGVGLVKPYFLLPSEQWEQVQQGYRSVFSLRFFEESRIFLEFYYLAAALYFYSLAIEAGRISPIENQRYLDYRDQFIQRATQNRIVDQAVGELQLFSTYPKSTPKIIIRRMKKLLGLNHAG